MELLLVFFVIIPYLRRLARIATPHHFRQILIWIPILAASVTLLIWRLFIEDADRTVTTTAKAREGMRPDTSLVSIGAEWSFSKMLQWHNRALCVVAGGLAAWRILGVLREAWELGNIRYGGTL